MDLIPFVDCQGLAGAWTLGTVQTGMFRLAHRASVAGGFGDAVADANRHLLPGAWSQDPAGGVRSWTPMVGIGLVCGTPPCSGFAVVNVGPRNSRQGEDHAVNSCMRELVGYAGRCWGLDGRRGPEVVAFESVPQAFTQGRNLMASLRATLERMTGEQYDLTHVLMSGATVGAAQLRHRYFFVAHRVPFGIDPPEPPAQGRVVTARDAIGDLEGLALQWEDQPYPQDYTWASEFNMLRRRGDNQVDAHMGVSTDPERGWRFRLVPEVAERGWNPGEKMPEAAVRQGIIPPELEHMRATPEQVARGATVAGFRGFMWPRRIFRDRPSYLLTGECQYEMVHYSEARFLTTRELARLMGYPDTWRWPTASVNQAGAWIGKCCPVNSGQWLSTWAGRSINGSPGARGAEIGEREYKIDVTHLYKQWPGGRRPPGYKETDGQGTAVAHV